MGQFAMMRLILAAAGAVTLLQMTAAAQDSWRSDEERLVRGIVQQDLVALVTMRGDSVEGEAIAPESEIDVSLQAATPEGLIYQLHGTACSEEGVCQGIHILVRYGFEGTPNYEFLNQANYSRAAASIWHLPGTIGVSRYLILDNGQTMANLKTNVDATLAMAPFMMEIAQNGLPEEPVPTPENG